MLTPQNIICLTKYFYVDFIPKINLTKPLKNFGTFLTTIVITFPSYLPSKNFMPPTSIPIPIMHIQAIGGRNNTNKVPIPKPIKIPASIFLNLQKNI